MNQKQLANVLIKILGLSFCVDGIIRIVSGAISFLAALTNRGTFGYSSASYYVATPLSGVAMGVIGILLIALSKPIADMLFKDE